MHDGSKNIEVIVLKKRACFWWVIIHLGFAYLMEITALLRYYN